MGSVCEVFNITVPELDEMPVVEKPCILCGVRNIVPVNTFVLNGKRFYTVRCLHDGMMWLDPQPISQFYQALYSTRYHASGLDDPLFE